MEGTEASEVEKTAASLDTTVSPSEPEASDSGRDAARLEILRRARLGKRLARRRSIRIASFVLLACIILAVLFAIVTIYQQMSAKKQVAIEQRQRREGGPLEPSRVQKVREVPSVSPLATKFHTTDQFTSEAKVFEAQNRMKSVMMGVQPIREHPEDDDDPAHFFASASEDAILQRLKGKPALAKQQFGFLGYTPLHFAVSNGHVKLAAALVNELKVDASARTLEGRTPLELALELHQDGLVALLEAEKSE